MTDIQLDPGKEYRLYYIEDDPYAEILRFKVLEWVTRDTVKVMDLDYGDTRELEAQNLRPLEYEQPDEVLPDGRFGEPGHYGKQVVLKLWNREWAVSTDGEVLTYFGRDCVAEVSLTAHQQFMRIYNRDGDHHPAVRGRGAQGDDLIWKTDDPDSVDDFKDFLNELEQQSATAQN